MVPPWRRRRAQSQRIPQRADGADAVQSYRYSSRHDARQPPRADVRRAQSEVSRRRRPSVHRHAESRRARRARHALHVGVHACPICVPARASFAVGRYVHDIGYWDNADGYDGAIPSWHHALRDAGHRVVSIGKLHFRGRKGDDHGFSEEIVPMHIIDGIGDVKGLIRERIPTRKGGDKMARKRAGPGESPYTVYDREIASRAQIWLHEEAPKWRDRPWVLFVSFVAPHFPLTAPARWFYRYWQQDLPMPKLYAKAERPHHPFIDDYARTVDYDPHFSVGGRREARDRRLQRPRVVDGRERRRRAARAARRGPRAATRACSTRATTATTPARAACGASPRSTRRARACR